MANKDSEVIDKKTIEKFRKEIRDDFETKYKDELVKELSDDIKKEVNSNINRELKNDIIDEVTNDVKDNIKNQIYKDEKRLSSSKSFKIFRLTIYILVLLCIIGYVGYRLYITDNVDLIKYDFVPEKNNNCNTSNNNDNNGNKDNKEDNKPQVDYKEKYGYLLDDLKIYDYSLYKDTYKATDLTMVQKLQMAYSTLSDKDMDIEGTIITIKSNVLRNAYIKLFGTDDYEPESFNIFSLNFVYSSNKDEYIAIVYTSNVEDIAYEVIDAGEDDNFIFVKAYAAKLQNGKVYNIKSDKVVGNASNKISEYGNRITIVTIRFNKDKNFYSITSE